MGNVGWAAGLVGRIAATVITVVGHQVQVGSLDNARQALTEARRRAAQRHEITALLATVGTGPRKAADAVVPHQSSAVPDSRTTAQQIRTTTRTPHHSPFVPPVGAGDRVRAGRLSAEAIRTARTRRARSAKATISADLAVDSGAKPAADQAADMVVDVVVDVDVAVDVPLMDMPLVDAGRVDVPPEARAVVGVDGSVVGRVDPPPGVLAPLTPASG